METSVQGNQTPHPNSKRWIIPSFFMIGLIFHVLMVLPTGMYGGFFHFATILTLALAPFLFYLFFKAVLFPMHPRLEYQWYDSYRGLLQMHTYRRTCLHLYQIQGFSKWGWYVLYFSGPLWMVVSLFVFISMGPQRQSLWILLVGMVGWCLLFLWQIRRERRWCSEAGTIDLRSLYGRILQFLIWNTGSLYFFYTYVNRWEEKLQGISIVILVLIHTCLFPNWFHLCLGQRKTYYKRTFFGSLLGICGYGNFSKRTPSPPVVSIPERENVKTDVVLCDWIVVGMLILLYFVMRITRL